MSRNRFLPMISILVLVSLVAFTSCQAKPQTMNIAQTADVMFKFNSSAFTEGNIESYRIQFRAIPLFGNSETPGRHTNWTDIQEDAPGSGIFVLKDIECGDWIFYVKVSNATKTFIDVCTGTVGIHEDYAVQINAEDTDLTGFGTQDIYIRADFVHENQSLQLVYENTATGAQIDVNLEDMEVVKSGRTTVDYYVNSGQIPCANYVLTAKIIGLNGVTIMSKEQTAEIRNTGTDVLVMRMYAEGSLPGGIIIGGGQKLEGILTGPEKGDMDTELLYKFLPLNTYTTENAVWYYWYAAGKRYSTREPAIYLEFAAPGMYVISCTPIGINGEVMKNGVCDFKTRIYEKGTIPDPEGKPEAGTDPETGGGTPPPVEGEAGEDSSSPETGNQVQEGIIRTGLESKDII